MPFLRKATISNTLSTAAGAGTTDSSTHLNGNLMMAYISIDTATTITNTITITSSSTTKSLLSLAVVPSTNGTYYYPRMYPQTTTGGTLSTACSIPIPLDREKIKMKVASSSACGGSVITGEFWVE